MEIHQSGSPNMHQLFYIEEILQVIFSNFNPPWEVDSVFEKNRGNTAIDLRTLRSLTLTCSKFLEVGNDQLWRDMWSLDPLLHLLPRDSVTVQEYQWRFVRPPSRPEWGRFNSHAQRVRSLYLEYDEVVEYPSFGRNHERILQFSQEFLNSLHGSFVAAGFGQLMFPLVRNVFYNPRTSAETGCCPLFLSPTLNSLEFYFNGPYPPIREISAVIIQSPSRASLQTLSLSPDLSHLEDVDVDEAWGPLLLSLPRLRCFSTIDFVLQDPRIVKIMIQIPTLEHIRSVDSQQRILIGAAPKQHTWDVRLEALRMLLNMTEKRNVIKLRTFSYSSVGEFRETLMYDGILSLMGQKCPNAEEIQIRVNTWGVLDTSHIPCAMPNFKAFNNIVVLSIHTVGRAGAATFIPQNDRMYSELCQSWPRLQKFTLHHQPNERVSSQIPEGRLVPDGSLHLVLQPFATYCRELRNLTLGLYLEMGPQDFTSSITRFSSTLAMLDISNSTIREEGRDYNAGDCRASMLEKYLLDVLGGRGEVIRRILPKAR